MILGLAGLALAGVLYMIARAGASEDSVAGPAQPARAPALQRRTLLSASTTGGDTDGEPVHGEAAPEISLADPGASPREPLRLAVTTGSKQPVTLELRIKVASAIGELPAPEVIMPPIRLMTTVTVTAVTESNDRHAELAIDRALVLEEPGVMPGMARAMRENISRLDGLRGFLVVSERGIVREADFDAPEDLPQELRETVEGLRQAMVQLTVPLPVEPIGDGASWTVSSGRARPDGVKIEQTTIYRLKSREGGALVLGYEGMQTGEPTVLDAPNAPEGVRVELVSLTTEGHGEATMTLDRLLPQKAKLGVESTMRTRVTFAGVHQRMRLEMAVGIEVLP